VDSANRACPRNLSALPCSLRSVNYTGKAACINKQERLLQLPFQGFRSVFKRPFRILNLDVSCCLKGWSHSAVPHNVKASYCNVVINHSPVEIGCSVEGGSRTQYILAMYEKPRHALAS
jgi:hypothetical protein